MDGTLKEEWVRVMRVVSYSISGECTIKLLSGIAVDEFNHGMKCSGIIDPVYDVNGEYAVHRNLEKFYGVL